MILVAARTLSRMDIGLSPNSTLREGVPRSGWGQKDRVQFQLDDVYMAFANEAVVHSRARQLKQSTGSRMKVIIMTLLLDIQEAFPINEQIYIFTDETEYKLA